MSETTAITASHTPQIGIRRAGPSLGARMAGLGRRRSSRGVGLYGRLVWFAGLFLTLWMLSFFGSSVLNAWLARLDHRQLAHPDRSVADSAVRSQVKPRVALVYRTQDGRRLRVLAHQEDFSRFVSSSMARLEAARTSLQGEVPRVLEAALRPTFTELDTRVEDFADWYFAWSTSYRLMGRAASAAATNALRPGAMDLSDAVDYELSRYMQRQYGEIVLQPERTDTRLQQQFVSALERLHRHYLDVMADLDADFLVFVTENTTHLDESLPVEEATLTVDWNSHLHKLSVAGYERGGLEAARGAGLVVAGGMLGRTLGAATIRRVSVTAARGLAPRLAAPYLGRATAAAAGAGVGVLGGPVGIVVGGAAGLGIDYLINEGVELTQRDDFEADVRDGLAVTQGQVQSVMEKELQQSVQVWFDDSIQLLAAYD